MTDLSTRTRRRNVSTEKNKAWVRISRGRALGYYKPTNGAGIWYARVYAGRQKYRIGVLGMADDAAPADGKEILNYHQAIEQASVWNPDEEDTREHRGPVTVREAVESYLDWYRVHRRAYDRIENVFETHILPLLGNLPVEALTGVRLRRWHQDLAEQPARLRGNKVRHARTPDEKRARKVTANHALTALKAALNHAAREGTVEGPGAWANVKPFRGVETARARYLDSEELMRLLNVCPPDFRDLVMAAIHTGARYGELARLSVGDYRPESGSVFIEPAKTGQPRRVYLSDDGAKFFERLTAGRGTAEPLLRKAGGERWGRSHQTRPMREACETAGLEPLGFHQLRHTYASLYLMNGGSLISLAKQLGHTSTRMVEKHYGHLADSWRAEEARRFAPSVSLPEPGAEVRRIGAGRRDRSTRSAINDLGSIGRGGKTEAI